MKSCPQCGKEYDEQTKFCPTDGSTLRTSAGENIIGSVIADRYHVLRKLGEGGMGQVYLAEHVKMGRMSAIKVMSSALAHDADAVGRFNREASNASKISHPNIAAIYDFGETSDGLMYLAMEYVEGESLTKLCEALGALPAPRAAEIARQVASALEAAHERGIVHRDLKPDNIMISRGRDGADLVKVVDFGIAKAAGGAGQKVTRTGLVVGTPEYMSPEQLTGDALDGRSDLYALALVTFNMLTGKLPFPGETTQETMFKRLHELPLTLAEVRPDLLWPAAVQQVLDKALARLASDRYQHASEYGDALVAAVAGMPADAPQSAPTRQVDATPTPAARATAAKAASASAATAVHPASARERYLVPSILAIALVAIVGGALYARARKARASPQAPAVAIVAPADSTLRSAPDTAHASTAMAAVDSSLRTPDSASTAAQPATDTATTSPPPAPAVVPPRPTRNTPLKLKTKRAATATPKHSDVASTQTTSAATAAATPPVVGAAPAPAPAPAPPPPPPPPPALATPEQGRAQVDAAGQLVTEGRGAEAIAMARRAMPLVTTRDDSVTALFYLAQGMVLRSAKTGEQESRKRACAILALISKATAHPKAEEIRSFSSRECK